MTGGPSGLSILASLERGKGNRCEPYSVYCLEAAGIDSRKERYGFYQCLLCRLRFEIERRAVDSFAADRYDVEKKAKKFLQFLASRFNESLVLRLSSSNLLCKFEILLPYLVSERFLRRKLKRLQGGKKLARLRERKDSKNERPKKKRDMISTCAKSSRNCA